MLTNRTCKTCGAVLIRNSVGYRESAAMFERRQTCGGACAKKIGRPRLVVPPRDCATCGTPLAQRPNESGNEFATRVTCGVACGRRLVGVNRKRNKPLEERFWEKVRKGAPDECWPWTAGAHHSRGYGTFKDDDGTVQFAHRVAWRLARGPIPQGKQVLHSCDNPPCCNPDCLFLGTHVDNMVDRDAKGRVTGAAITRLSAADVEQIRVACDAGMLQRHVAAAFGVTPSYVSQIVNGQRRRGASIADRDRAH